MTLDSTRDEVIRYWLHKANQALESARSEFREKRYDFAVNRLYYSCFYAASAVLFKQGRKFIKHSGLRGAVHRDLVKAGILDVKWGKAFDRIFERRQAADYLELQVFTEPEIAEMIIDAEGFVDQMKRLLA